MSASDIHLKAEQPPYVRVHGILQPIDISAPKITKDGINSLALSVMDEGQRTYYQQYKEVDIGLGVSGLGRFRINIFQQRGSVRMVIRVIPFIVPTLTDLNLPEPISKIADYERGLVLVCGATGSGKSSTLAAIIDLINRTKTKHIVTLEDPIEFLIHDQKSLISQREIGIDTLSFPDALRSALRQDPNIILIGEMRDKATIDIALTAAETGHLVLSTLHTIDAQETINRILSMHDPHQLYQIRSQLASVLKAIISQRLVRIKDGRGFVPAVEILINNKRIQDMITDQSKTSLIKLAIEEGRSGRNMQSFDQSLIDLLSKNLISYEEALLHTDNPDDFALKYSGITNLERKDTSSKKNNRPTSSSSLESIKSQMSNTNIEFDDSYRSRKKIK